MVSQGRKLLSFGCQAVLIKSGHFDNKESTNWLITHSCEWIYSLPKVRTQNTHGTVVHYLQRWLLSVLTLTTGKIQLSQLKIMCKIP